MAKLCSDFLDTVDISEKSRIEKLGVEVKATNTIMRSLEDKIDLARTVLESH